MASSVSTSGTGGFSQPSKMRNTCEEQSNPWQPAPAKYLSDRSISARMVVRFSGAWLSEYVAAIESTCWELKTLYDSVY
jgi:hypothetical protein